MGSKPFLIQVDGTADAAFAVDATGLIRVWNNAAAELFGLSEGDAISVSCHEILQASEKGVVSCEHYVIEGTAQDNRRLLNFDLRVQTKTGKLWCNLSILIASDQESGNRYIIHIVRPCEMQKLLEQALSEFVRRQARNIPNGSSMISASPTSGINVRLTAREVEVLKSLAKGHSTRAIANQLYISSATVNNHIKHILTKFRAHTRLEAIRRAESVGVI
ncbi:MAG TPA: LuxR C-terminal-related transcriptional regulator [Pyrinomonadaceae bacterium]|nr:LuxR C-terminal-related transcriptional regulator [Pyrinomonadaceae bacterium]